jgi:hypothetical protein
MAENDKTLVGAILDKLGVAEYFQRFRFGGFVGKLTMFGGVAVVVIGAIALKLHDDRLIFAALVIAALLAFFVVHRVSSFADKHPELAMFEGAEILQWEQMKIEAQGISPARTLLGKPLREADRALPPAAEPDEGKST